MGIDHTPANTRLVVYLTRREISLIIVSFLVEVKVL